jgi:ATP-dependent helicase/nuclease subunit A
VLVRARSHLDALVAEIRRSAPELRFQAVEIEGLDGRQHVQDLLTLFRALHHRADRVHWLALLRAPWCGLTAGRPARAGRGRQAATIWQLMQDEARLARLSANGRQRLRHVREVLALAFAGRAPASAALAGRRLADARRPALPGGAGSAGRCRGLLPPGRQAGGRAQSEPETLAAQTAELFAPPDPLAAIAVQMMTIHKSKGLEFETVILPGLHRETGGNDSSLLLWDEVAGADGEEHLLVAPMKPRAPAMASRPPTIT